MQAVGQLDAAQPPQQLQIATVAELPGPRRFGTADASGGTSTPAERNPTCPPRRFSGSSHLDSNAMGLPVAHGQTPPFITMVARS